VKIVWAGHHEFTPSEIERLRLFKVEGEEARLRCLVFSCVAQPALKSSVREGVLEMVELGGGSFEENWKSMLADLGSRGMHRLMVEPGAALSARIFECGLWNRLDLWRSTDQSIEMRLERDNLAGLSYPELPSGIVAKESFIIGPDVLTVYER
jgi:diaminohydroxyphosphoribosylaminopyrimidine deaminase/5-amino-6-(5-phosphoribosylamino)uracil reductase